MVAVTCHPVTAELPDSAYVASGDPPELIGKPLVYNIVRPLAIVNIATVATNGGTLNLVITRPLKKPNNAPIIIKIWQYTVLTNTNLLSNISIYKRRVSKVLGLGYRC